MCVYNELNKLAIVRSEYVVYTIFDLLIKKQMQRQVVDSVYNVQEGIQSQLPVFEKDRVFKDFLLYHKVRLDKIREIEEKNQSPSLKEDKRKLLKEETALLEQVIEYPLLRYKFYDDTFRKLRKLESGGHLESMEIYFNLLNASLNYLKIQQAKGRIKDIFNDYTEDLENIEHYKKMLDECKYYKGFHFHSIGKWNLIVKNNNQEIFNHESPMLCLRRKDENNYYPYKYMVICVDYKIENGGSEKKEAYKNTEEAFQFHFNNYFKTGGNAGIFDQIVKRESVWKDTFDELISIGNVHNIESENHQYTLNIDTGDSSGKPYKSCTR